MEQCWRWFGPEDPIALRKVRQAGATGVVSALHHLAPGAIWSPEAISARQAVIESAGLTWRVVESLPVPTSIRLSEAGHEADLERYIQSLENLGQAGIRTICYNFMPVIDWTRTELAWQAPDGSLALRFEASAWVAFDVFLLQRPGAEAEYNTAQLETAERYLAGLSEAQRKRLIADVASGLPGANEEGHSLESLRDQLARWQGVTPDILRKRLIQFLSEVVPTCERYGMRLAIHPDDPPRPLLGLPRIASCGNDFEILFQAVPSESNGVTLCVGSLTAGSHNNASTLVRRLAPRIHFAHLRSVALEPDGSFVEADHLDGDADLVDVIRVLVAEERKRHHAGRLDWSIAMRPDHGRALDGDIDTLPGYPWLGRLKGLAELRGVLRAVEALT
ncbi:MAG: mannonate dehydratase [Myxococcales bacterium]|nr:mannonate dehydratase [Myxococcales bacterium]